MARLEKVENLNQIYLNNDWQKSNIFKGKIISYQGHQYQVVAKYTRQFSTVERIKRSVKGILIIIFTLGTKWKSKKVNKFLHKSHESKRFVMLVNHSDESSKKIDNSTQDRIQNPIIEKTQPTIPIQESQNKPLALLTLTPPRVALNDHISPLPLSHHHCILSFLNQDALAKNQLVSKTWRTVSSTVWYSSLPEITIGKAEWAKIGDVGKVPPIPASIHKIVKRACPFCPGKIIQETHTLLLVPETVGGENFNLKWLINNFHFHYYAHPDSFKNFRNDKKNNAYYELLATYGDRTSKAHWVLMPHNTILESKIISSQNDRLTFKECQELIAKYAQETSLKYEIPNVLEAAALFYMNRSIMKERMKKNDDDWVTITMCQELLGDQIEFDDGDVIPTIHPVVAIKKDSWSPSCPIGPSFRFFIDTDSDINDRYKCALGLTPMIKFDTYF